MQIRDQRGWPGYCVMSGIVEANACVNGLAGQGKAVIAIDGRASTCGPHTQISGSSGRGATA
jgi:hypothetical protein